MSGAVCRVACRVPNGVVIRLSKPGVDDGTGTGLREFAHDGPGIRLNGPSSLHTGAGNTDGHDLDPGITEVDAEWMGKWVAQHALDPLVLQRQVYVADGEGDGK